VRELSKVIAIPASVPAGWLVGYRYGTGARRVAPG
jgi:hypothetical protein